ncbi:type II toxin-antitoxin system VapB family antitoxin [Cyanobium sp. CH-040]|uniref:type II toxin-antitoxin system VapB family antitoxin n=1 Tax=Cyanobium sp. CH-040 TaxID=2823708 RepID=UPI0020CCCF91|nr:type II toxin-antitoxin system VapB family antitoxin [Cyanobium sp. CH-040]
MSGIPERSRLLREALQALVARESARRLARLGGSELQLEVPPRCYRESTWTVAP